MDADRTEMLLSADALRFHLILDGRDRAEGKFFRSLLREHVEVLDIGELSTLARSQANDHRDLLISLTQGRHRVSADGCRGGVGYIAIRETRQVGALGIDFEFYFRAFLKPVVLHCLDAVSAAQNILNLSGEAAEVLVIFRFLLRVDVRDPGYLNFHWKLDWIGLELMDRDISAGNLGGERGL